MKCRFCSAPIQHSFCDLGKSPPSNSYLKSCDQSEVSFPLHAHVCSRCFLVQVDQFQKPEEIFSDYAYFSSYSTSWVEHSRKFAEKMVERFQPQFVIEIASNDGYLLQHFKAKEVPILGIEPAKKVAQAALAKGIPTLTRFFGSQLASKLAKQGTFADLLIGNNVLSQVPDLNDFVSGLKIILNRNGIVTLEFQHLLQLIEQNQFDTIYHEHFSYFSLLTFIQIAQKHNLQVFDVEELATHGGSLRIYLQHIGGPHRLEKRVSALMERESSLHRIETYHSFSERVQRVKTDLLNFLTQVKKEGKKIAGYGAPAKGNTLLNFCGINTDLLPFTVDLSLHKQGHFLPGSHIPIYPVEKIFEFKPDYLLILPWNLKEEIQKQMEKVRTWHGKFVIPIPHLTIEE